MGVKPTHDRRLRRVRASLTRLASDTEQVRDKIAIHKMRGVSNKYGEVISHVEAWIGKSEMTRTTTTAPDHE